MTCFSYSRSSPFWQAVPIPSSIKIVARLERTLATASRLLADCREALRAKAPKQPLEAWSALLERLERLPVQMDEITKVTAVMSATQDWFARARTLLDLDRDPSDDDEYHAVQFEVGYWNGWGWVSGEAAPLFFGGAEETGG